MFIEHLLHAGTISGPEDIVIKKIDKAVFPLLGFTIQGRGANSEWTSEYFVRQMVLRTVGKR